MFKTFRDVAESLRGFIQDYRKAKKERKEDIARLYRKIGTCLKEVSEELEKGIYPYGKCEMIATYAKELPDTIGKEIGERKAKKYSEALLVVHKVEKANETLKKMDIEDRKLKLVPLKEAAGKFLALSDLILAT